jgi:ligand-binding sensor domain-containing protein
MAGLAPLGPSLKAFFLFCLALLAAGAQAGAQAAEGRLTLAEPPSPGRLTDRYAAHLGRAELAYQARDMELSYREYLAAVNSAGAETKVPGLVWLRLAQLALYDNRDTEGADFYSRRIEPGELPAAEADALERLRRRLSYRELGAESIGLGDGNISALRVDEDDLWIGTWNGGVSRLSLSSGQVRIFREGRESLVPSTVRCIEIAASRVWIGTYQGLFAYSKAGGSWQEIESFGGADPRKVEALRLAAGRLYVGTLGQGLWRQEAEGWSRVSSGLLPGDFVTCLETDGEDLLIGTLTQGVVRLNLASLALRGFEEPEGGLEARNITVLLADPPRGFWIGSYGKGLFYWDRQAARLAHFSRAGGQLGDDWVLCAVRAAGGTYFGTLGGGLARHSGGAWERLGFREGVLSSDIPAMAYAAPFLYLGSLGAGVTVLREGQP